MSAKLDALAAAEAATADTNRIAYYIAVMAADGHLPDGGEVANFQAAQDAERTAWRTYRATLTTL